MIFFFALIGELRTESKDKTRQQNSLYDTFERYEFIVGDWKVVLWFLSALSVFFSCIAGHLRKLTFFCVHACHFSGMFSFRYHIFVIFITNVTGQNKQISKAIIACG